MGRVGVVWGGWVGGWRWGAGWVVVGWVVVLLRVRIGGDGPVRFIYRTFLLLGLGRVVGGMVRVAWLVDLVVVPPGRVGLILFAC